MYILPLISRPNRHLQPIHDALRILPDLLALCLVQLLGGVDLEGGLLLLGEAGGGLGGGLAGFTAGVLFLVILLVFFDNSLSLYTDRFILFITHHNSLLRLNYRHLLYHPIPIILRHSL
jgi:hypothetical protein